MNVKYENDGANEYIMVDHLILTSPYSYEDEDKRFINKLNKSIRSSVLIIFGLGLGKYLQKLESTIHQSNFIIIIEPSDEILGHYRRSSEQIISKRLVILTLDEDDIIEFLNSNELNTRFKLVYSYMNYRNVFQEKYKHLVENIRNDSIKKFSNEVTLKLYDYEFTKNIFNNYFFNEFHIPVNALKNQYKDVPALIVSAGPSLEKHIDCINSFQGLIFSGGRTIKEFLTRNIRMDFMVSVDPTDKVYELVEGADSLGIMPPLFTYLESNSQVVRNHNSIKILMNSPSVPLIIKKDLKLDVIPSGPSVSNIALSIADYLGCNPIVLIGQDLSFTNGKHHADITVKHFDQEPKTENLIIEVDAYYGGKIKTSASFYSMQSHFESLIRISDKNIINATEGGVYIHGAKHIPFRDYLSEQSIVELSTVNERFNSICNKEPIYKSIVETDIYEVKITKLSNILNKCVRISKEIYMNIKKNKTSNINSKLEHLITLDQQIKDEMANDAMLNYIFSSAHIDFENEIRRHSDNDSLISAKSNLTFYQTLNENIKKLQNFLRENSNGKSS